MYFWRAKLDKLKNEEVRKEMDVAETVNGIQPKSGCTDVFIVEALEVIVGHTFFSFGIREESDVDWRYD